MQRSKKPTLKRKPKAKKPELGRDQEKAIKKILSNLSEGWTAEERETAINFDHYAKEVHLETTYPPTARRWFKNLWGDENVKWDLHASSLKITVPWEYCRQPDLIIKANYRVHE